MKKPIVVLWLVGMFVLCLAASYLVAVKQHTHASSKDITFLTWTVAAAIFVLLGLVSWAVYYFMKKRGNMNAAKTAMLVFTGLSVAGLIGTYPDGIRAMKTRNNFLNRDEFKKGFMESCVEEGNKNLGVLENEGIKDPAVKIQNYCSCVYDKIEANPELMEMMMEGSMPNSELMNDKRVLKMATECALDMFK